MVVVPRFSLLPVCLLAGYPGDKFASNMETLWLLCAFIICQVFDSVRAAESLSYHLGSPHL